MITKNSEKTIKEFLASWWELLGWQVRRTVNDTSLPILTPDELEQGSFGQTLQLIAAAAEGLLPDSARDEVIDAVQLLCELMFSRPGMPAAYEIPADWWVTPMGSLALQAYVWATGDSLITITEAAEISGRSLSSISQMISRGRLTGYPDASDPRATRVLLSEVKSLPPAAGKKKKGGTK